MSKRATFAYAMAGVLALAAGAASAQSSSPYGSSKYQSGNYTAQSPNGYYYDACKREQTGRGTVGAVLGGGAGAVIGSNVAARNARTEGALLGGLLGAIAGGVVGNKSAACTSDPAAAGPAPTASTYSPAPVASAPPPARSDRGYYDRDAYAGGAGAAAQARADAAREDAWSTDRRGERYRVTERAPGPDGCTLAESPIYMPDGRTQTRFVRVCRDASGRYAVVD